MLYSTLFLTWLTLLQGPPAHWGDHVKALSNASTNEGRFEALTKILREHELGFTVESFTIDGARGGEPRTIGRNIIVSIGNGPEDLVLGAHYDAVRLPDGSLSRGAVDNAASCEMLVELAARLRFGVSSAFRVRIVWFDMEELGLLGSAAYVKAHQSDRIRAMLNFDINAYGDTVLFGAPSGGENDRLRQVVFESCAAQNVECLRLDPMPPGDDRPFGQARIPTLSIATLPAIEAHQLYLMAKAPGHDGGTPRILTTIHTPNDTVDKVDGTALRRMYELVAGVVFPLTTSLISVPLR